MSEGENRNFTFKIKNFGNDKECDSVSELLSVIDSEFRGRSISIVFPTEPHGMIKTVFVDVSDDGDLTYSYGNQKKFSLQVLEG